MSGWIGTQDSGRGRRLDACLAAEPTPKPSAAVPVAALLTWKPNPNPKPYPPLTLDLTLTLTERAQVTGVPSGGTEVVDDGQGDIAPVSITG